MQNRNFLDVLVDKLDRIHCNDCRTEIKDSGNYALCLKKVYCVPDGKSKTCGQNEVINYINSKQAATVDFAAYPVDMLKNIKELDLLVPAVGDGFVLKYLKILRNLTHQ